MLGSRDRLRIKYMLLCMAAYFFLDFSVRITDFLVFGDSIGVKNFMSSLAGLIFGPAGAIGCALGCILTSLCVSSFGIYTLYESLACLITGCGIWALWHLAIKNGKVFLKSWKEYRTYLELLFILASIDGLMGAAILPEHEYIPLFTAYFILGIIVGIPIIILLTSIVCIEPILPPWVKAEKPFEGVLTSDSESFMRFSEGLEEYAMEKKVKMKEIFGIQNCVEEIMLRVFAANPEVDIKVSVRLHDSASLRLEFEGERYNPFRALPGVEAEDMIGLKLLLHRALRSSHSYHDGKNLVHVVV